ncbi:hypothetical protein JK176_01655 [Gluconobacter sp. Dm-73]|uniref:hypothetical protein n=1 Tax=Gluconobacter sp. Dm-73 TaxID=2799802 RepID=UPI001B8C31F9|nr:hypothetical protein [Gluconobacter sp. Dm-73]MBS1073592.1 hypothetical protein [Gluconobacter sp. Dm-73]
MVETVGDLTLTYDEMASLRSYLIATVFEFSDCIEIGILGMFQADEILSMANKVYSLIRWDKKEYTNIFSDDDCKIIKSCIFHGEMAIGIYSTYKKYIDYETCDFGITKDKIYNYIHEYRKI